MGYNNTTIRGQLSTQYIVPGQNPEHKEWATKLEEGGWEVTPPKSDALMDCFYWMSYCISGIKVTSEGTIIFFEGEGDSNYFAGELTRSLSKADTELGILDMHGVLYLQGEEFPDFSVVQVRDSQVKLVHGEVHIHLDGTNHHIPVSEWGKNNVIPRQ